MKFLKNISFGIVAVSALGFFATSCSEEATLDGADAVYIEISPSSDITLFAGQKMKVSAKVTNVSGKEIQTPMEWSADESGVIEFGANDTIIAVADAQGKSTKLRVTLPNKQTAVANVSVVNRSLYNALKPLTESKVSYELVRNDTAWFSVTPIELVDEYPMSWSAEILEMKNEDANPEDYSFYFAEGQELYIDREESRVGVVYTAPRCAAEAQVSLTIGSPEDNVTASVPVTVCPKFSPGFEVEGKRPLPSEANVSNVKVTNLDVVVDVNSTYSVGVCVGMDGYEEDFKNAEVFGKWELSGSGVILEKMYVDPDYLNAGRRSGYVAYLDVRSGAMENTNDPAIIKYTLPGAELICKVTVEDYSISHPVEYIVVSKDGVETKEFTVKLGDSFTFDVWVEPKLSWSYHIPVIESSNPAVVTVPERGEDDGYGRSLETHSPGEAYLTLKSLDKTETVKVTVLDQVSRIDWQSFGTVTVNEGQQVELSTTVYMASDPNTPATSLPEPIQWVVSDPSVASVETKAGDPFSCVITGLKEGTMTLQAICDGKSAERREVSVVTSSDVTLEGETNYDDAGASVYRTGDGLWINYGNYDETFHEFFILLPGVDSLDGTFVLNSTDFSFDGIEYDDVACNITITSDGDGYCVLNGECTMPSGQKLVFKNARFYVDE